MKVQREVKRGAVTGVGATVPEAKASLAAAIDHLCEHARGPHVESRFGLLLIVSAAPVSAGYAYTIVDPADMAEDRRFWQQCGYSAPTLEAAVQVARKAACQRAWSLDADDEAHIRRADVSSDHEDFLRRLFAAYRAATRT